MEQSCNSAIITDGTSVLVRNEGTEFIAVVSNHHQLMSDRQARKDLSRELANYKPSRYSKVYSLYQRRTLPKVDPILRAIALQSPLASRLPVYKTLKAAAKMLLLNEIELVVMVILVRESKWNIEDAVIMENEQSAGELLCFPCENNEYRRLTLYLLLVGWGAKSALNEDCQDMLNEVRRVCFNFKTIFQQWVYPYVPVLTLHPATLNRLYSFYLNPTTTAIIDYQLMVDTILQLSQAYTCEKDAERPLPRSPVRRPAGSLSSRPKASRVFAHFAQVKLEQVECVEEKKEEFDMNVFGNRDLSQSIQFPGIFGSSMGGIFGLGSIQASKKSQLEYFEIELGEGDHNFMVFSQGDPTLSSVLGIQRAVSNTEHFLQQEDGRSDC